MFIIWIFTELITLTAVGKSVYAIIISIPNSHQSLDIGKSSDGGIWDFQNSGESLININCHKPLTRNNIDMKFGPVTKRDKRNTATSKKFKYDVISLKFDVIVIFWFMANLEQSRSWNLEAWSPIPSCSLLVTFYLTRTGNRTKKFLT